jgi:hypothetical protein
MKKLSKIIFLAIATLLVLPGTYAQDCAGYFPVKEGTMLGYKSFDDKGKVTGTRKQTILSKTATAKGSDYVVKSEVWDAKDKLLSETTLHMRCEGGKFFMDMKNFLDPKSMGEMKDMQMEVNGVDMEIPSEMTVGQTLPDANMTLAFSSNNMVLMKMTVNITNRKVVDRQSVTVPAGTFDCLKLTYDIETKTLFKMSASAAEWMAKGPGIVKTETYDKKGKVSSSQELTEFKE